MLVFRPKFVQAEENLSTLRQHVSMGASAEGVIVGKQKVPDDVCQTLLLFLFLPYVEPNITVKGPRMPPSMTIQTLELGKPEETSAEYVPVSRTERALVYKQS